MLALASLIPAAGQTSATAPAQRPAAAAPAATVGPAKVAVIAFQAAVTQTNEFQRNFADLQKKYDPRRQQLKSLSDEVDTLTKQLQDQSAQLSESERISRTRTVDEKKKQLDRDTQDAQSDFQSDMQQVINAVATKVGALMTDYAEKHGYTLVLHRHHQGNHRRLQPEVGHTGAASAGSWGKPAYRGCAPATAGGYALNRGQPVASSEEQRTENREVWRLFRGELLTVDRPLYNPPSPC